MSSDLPNWNFGPDQGVTCPTCGAVCSGLDWVLGEADGAQVTTGARVFPCNDVIATPPWQFGPTGSTGALKFTKIG